VCTGAFVLAEAGLLDGRRAPTHWRHTALEAAQALIVAGHTVTSAAARSGLGSDETLRRVFLRHLNTSPTAYRARFAASDAVSWTP